MGYIISTDATCDLTKEQQQTLGIRVLDMLYFVNGDAYGQGEQGLTLDDFYEKMRSGEKVSTSMVNEMDVEEYFVTLLKEGKDILHVAFSSGLSGTYDCTYRVAKRLNEQHSNQIYVVDSKNGSTGEGLLVEYAVKRKEEGKSIRENVELLTGMVENVNSFFTVQDLKYLVAGGRISKSTAVIGNMLHIKPIIYADSEGKIVQGGKVIGEKKALFTLVEKVKQKFTDLYNKIYVSHANCKENALLVFNKLKAALPKANIYLGEIGPVMGSHCGPGTLAVFFFGKKRCY